MTSGRQAGAYPSLIPGAQEGARDAHKPWDVIELEDGPKGGYAGPTTSKVSRIMKVPKPVLQHDWLVRYHELCHVERPHFEPGPNKLRNQMRAMLEEVALDGMALNRDGIDLRSARDSYDWSKYRRPQDVYQAAAVFFQLYTSAQVSKDAELQKLYGEVVAVIGEAERAEPKLEYLYSTLEDAAHAVFNDYSSGNCEDWADIVTAKLLGVPKEEIPDAPEHGANSGAGASVSPEQDGDEPEGGTTAGDSDPPTGGPGASADPHTNSDEGAEGGSGVCEACDGEGVDEDGEECRGCQGTGTTTGNSSGSEPGSSDGSDPSGPAGVDQGAEQSTTVDSGGEGFSEWDTPPVPLDKDRQNDPMDFGFDPLGKSDGVNPHELPPEKGWKEREVITKEQLQEAIDRDRVNRKQGESSQNPELTARTPHGAVDVHRHTLNRSTSTSVALGWRSSQDGVTVRYPSQMYPDGRVFAKRAPGGSIILDGSGSMDWHTQHIVQAQKQMPNLYVAVYSYHGSNGYWRASKGYVAMDTFIARYCIVAQKGKLDPEGITTRNEELGMRPDGTPFSLHTGENSGADPASLWYAARWAPKPIVWVSDGMVSFGESQRFYAQCDAIMRQHKIVRVLTIEDAIDYLLGKAVPGWHQSATVGVRWVRLGQPMQQQSQDPKATMSEAYEWTKLRANSRKR